MSITAPTDITGCVLWLDANQITGLVDNDPVATWPDLAGGAYDFTQATATRRPVYKTNLQSGKPGVRFTAASTQYLERADTAALDLAGAKTILVVLKTTDASAVIMSHYDAASPYGGWAVAVKIWGANNGAPGTWADGGGGGSTTFNDGVAHVVDYRFSTSPNTREYHIDGVADPTGGGAGGSTASSNTLALGSQHGGGSPINADIFEVVIYNKDLTAAERTDITNYLLMKWKYISTNVTKSLTYAVASPALTYAPAGSAGAYYPAVFVGGVQQWDNHAVSHGDCDLTITDGVTPASFSNVTYDSYVTVGDVTTFTKALSADYDLQCVVTLKASGTYKIEHKLHNKTAGERRLTLKKTLAGTNDGRSNHSTFKTANSNNNAEVFQAAGIHSGNVCATLTPGNGYDNQWALYGGLVGGSGYSTAWPNTAISGATASDIYVQYGMLGNLSTTDYSVHVAAGATVTLSTALGLSWPITTINQFRKLAYDTYHDVFSPVVRTGFQKTLWATSHQLLRIRRHVHGDINHQWIVPSYNYQPDCYTADMWHQGIGLGDSNVAQRIVDLCEAFGPISGYTVDNYYVRAYVDNAMNGTNPVRGPYFLAYCNKSLGLTVTAGMISDMVAIADGWLNLPGEMLPPYYGQFDYWNTAIPHGSVAFWRRFASGKACTASAATNAITCVGHGYANGTAVAFMWTTRPDGVATGGVYTVANATADTFTLVDAASNPVDITTDGTGSVGLTPTRVTTDGGVVPDVGTYMAKLTSVAGSISRIRPVPISVPSSKQVTITARINIPSPFGSGGFRIVVEEGAAEDKTSAYGYGTLSSVLATQAGAYTTSTVGWQNVTLTFTTSASTRFIWLAVESVEAGTAYVDQVRVNLTDASYTGTAYLNLIYDVTTYPDTARADSISPDAFFTQRRILDLRSIKGLVGASWTAGHQALLDKLTAAWPALYWTDVTETALRYTLFHPVRSDWTELGYTMYPHWFIYLLFGERYLSNTQIANLYANYPHTSLGATTFRIMSKLDGVTQIESDEHWFGMADGAYIRGASWLHYDSMFHMSAYWAGVAGAYTNYGTRLNTVEVASEYVVHEYLNDPSGTCPGGGFAYGNHVMLLADTPILLQASNIDTQGCDLSWTQYQLSDFDTTAGLGYQVRRDTVPNITNTSGTLVASITTQTTVTYHDTSASPGTQYYYAVFVYKTTGAVTKSTEIAVETVGVVTLTKSLQYAVRVAVAVTKSLQYAVLAPHDMPKSLQYTIKSTPAAITKSARYTVRAAVSAITKSLQYTVRTTPAAATKALTYRVLASTAITKAAAYRVKTTPAAITKSLQYAVNPGGLLTKSLQYAVRAPHAVPKALTYHVKLTTAATKSLRYATRAGVAVTKSLRYVVRTTPAAVTKAVAYRVRTTPAAITKGLTYNVAGGSPTNVTKTLQYAVMATPAAILKGLRYVLTPETVSSPLVSTIDLLGEYLTTLSFSGDFTTTIALEGNI